MELLVEQTYRFPDKPPKNVAGLIDRASLLAFYRVHNAGLATEAKVEEILSGYRGRTHVLALMLAKKYGKKLVERLQSTPRSPASTARRGRALRPVNSSARQQRTKKKVRAAVVAEESVPFATSPNEERAAVASARLEARYAAERLHRERTRRAEEAVEVERARATRLEQELVSARSEAARIKATATVASENLNAAATALDAADAEAAAARAETTRLEAQLAKSVQVAPTSNETALLARATKAENAAKAAAEAHHRVVAALAKAERDRDAAKDQCVAGERDRELAAATEAKRVASERKRVTAALEAATAACRQAEATAIAARRERDDARAESEAVAQRHASEVAAAREDAAARCAADTAANNSARADAARLEAELADAAAEVERLTSAVLANNDDSASACAEAEALELRLAEANTEVARLAEEAAANAFKSETAAAAREAALVDATARAEQLEKEAAARDEALLNATARASRAERAATAATEEHRRLSDEREAIRRERDALAVAAAEDRAASEAELSKLKSTAEQAQTAQTAAWAEVSRIGWSEAALRRENSRLIAAAERPTVVDGGMQTSPPKTRERSPPNNGPGPRSPPRTVRAVTRRRSRRRGRSPTPRGCRSSMPRTAKLKPSMSAPLVLEPATSKRPVLLAKRSHHHVSAPVEEVDDDEAVPPDEVPKTRRHFGPWGRVLAYFCLAVVALSLRTGRVKAPVVPRSPTIGKSTPPSMHVQSRRRRLPGVKLGRSGLLVAGAAARPVANFFTRRPVLRKIGGFVARAGISNTVTRGLRKVLRRAIPVLKTR